MPILVKIRTRGSEFERYMVSIPRTSELITDCSGQDMIVNSVAHASYIYKEQAEHTREPQVIIQATVL